MDAQLRVRRRLAVGLALGIALAAFVGPRPIDARANADEDALPSPTRHVDGGEIEGTLLPDGVAVFRGIPYAAPPVGDRRWKPPAPVEPWEGTRACTEFGSWCPQPKPMLGSERGTQDEDCLTLNVWSAAVDGKGDGKSAPKRPVMVWIHGGGFVNGSGAQSTYDGARFAAKGVVLVTVNYRLGPFGFFAHPLLSKESSEGVSGNYGFLDQVAALRWVQRNAEAFGGDPANVTIFGESAGAVSVGLHLISPLSKGLFHRAIMQSGSVFGDFRHLRESGERLPSMESEGERLARALNCDTQDDSLAALRAVPAERLLAVSKPAVGLFGKGLKLWPVIDGWAIPSAPSEILEEGGAHRVPVMVGSNADEATVFLKQLPVKRVGGYRALLRMIYRADAPAVKRLFPVTRDDQVRDALNDVVTIGVFTTSARRAARAFAQSGANVWRYHFTRVPPARRFRELGAFHSAEIPYVFGKMDLRWGFDRVDRALSEAMQDAWIAFAKTGDPNATDPPDTTPPNATPPNATGESGWPAYDVDTDAYLEFGESAKARTALHAKACDLFDAIARK